MPIAIERNKLHTVGENENIFLIAKLYGFRNWQTIYQHEKNDDFRAQNPDPYVLFPGSQVWIPEFIPKQVTCEAGKNQKFVLKVLKMQLQIQLEEEEAGISYANKKYEIWIDGQKYGTEELRTTPMGFVSAEIPVVNEIELHIWFGEDDEEPTTYTVQLGGLDPIDTISGVQNRLNNLGYETGNEDGVLGPATEAALKEFQLDYDLPVTGEIDEATREKLREVHDV